MKKLQAKSVKRTTDAEVVPLVKTPYTGPCVAVAPELATEGAYCVCCGRPARVPDGNPQAQGGRPRIALPHAR